MVDMMVVKNSSGRLTDSLTDSVMVLIVPWEGNVREKRSRSSWPVGLSLGCCDCLNWVGKTHGGVG